MNFTTLLGPLIYAQEVDVMQTIIVKRTAVKPRHSKILYVLMICGIVKAISRHMRAVITMMNAMILM